MNYTTKIRVRNNGQIEWLGDVCPLPDLPLGNTVRRRVSTIQPVNYGKRMAFLFLRLVAGDRGRVAAFTRKWKGPWKVTILATGQSAVFERRAEAISWEIQIIETGEYVWKL